MSEKRYFKIFSERHTIGNQNKYVALFDKLDKIEIENDKEIKAALSKSGINSDFLSADKNYLYQLVLKSLNDFHWSKTKNLEIKEALISIEILFYKGLYAECLSLIAKAEVIAEECENFQLRIELLMWKKKCSGYSLGLAKAAEVNQQIDIYINQLLNLKNLTDLYYQSNLLQANNDRFSEAKVIKKFKDLIAHPELKSEKSALSFTAKIQYYLVYANYYLVLNDQKNELEKLQKLIDLIHQSKTYALENPLDYISIYNRLLGIKKFFNDNTFFDDIKTLNEFAKNVHLRKEVVAQRVFIHTNTHEIEHYLIKNDYKSAIKKITEIEKEILKIHFSIEPYHLIYFYYLHVVALIFVGQFHKALKFVNNILNEFIFEARPQVYFRAEVLNIIIHFELKNFSLVSSLAKKIIKENASKQILASIEEKIVTTIVKISNTKNLTVKDETHALSGLLKDLTVEKHKINSNQVALIENYEKWLVSKIESKSEFDSF